MSKDLDRILRVRATAAGLPDPPKRNIWQLIATTATALGVVFGTGAIVDYDGPAIPPPTVVSLSHPLGDPTGGHMSLVTGTNFTGTTAVTVGGTSTDFWELSDTQLLIILPPKAAGTYSVGVTTSGGGAGTPLASAYEAWSPAQLSMNTFWDRGDYLIGSAGGVWTGKASAGASGTRNLTQNIAAGIPSETCKAPAFNGSASVFDPSLLLSDCIGLSAYGGFAIVNARSMTNAAASYDNGAIIGSVDSVYWGVFLKNNTATMYHWDGGDKVISAAASTNQQLLIHWKYDGTNLRLGVNGTWATPVAAGSVTTGAVGMRIGRSRAGANKFLDGNLFTLGTLNTAPSDATFDKIIAWAKSRHGVTNGTAPEIHTVDFDVWRPSTGFQVLVTGKNLGAGSPTAYICNATDIYSGTVNNVNSDGTAALVTFPALPAGDYTIGFKTTAGLGQLAASVKTASPATTGTCVLWHDSAQGVTVNGSSQATAWADSSGIGDTQRNGGTSGLDPIPYNATDSHYSNKPTIGTFRDTTFTNRRFAHAGAWNASYTGFSMGIVGHHDSGVRYFTFESTAQYNALVAAADGPRVYSNDSTNALSDGGTWPADTPAWFHATFGGASSAIYLHNTKPAVTGNLGTHTLGLTGLKVGSYQGSGDTYGAKRLAAVYAHSPALTEAQIRTVRGWAESEYFSNISNAAESLTAFFRDFTTSPWVGSASAGSSGSRNLVQASGFTYPSAGSALNGHAVASFNGTTDGGQIDLTPKTVNNVLGAGSSYSFGVLVYVPTPPTDSGLYYGNRAIVGSAGAYYCQLGVRSSGIVYWDVDGIYQCSVSGVVWNTWNYFQVDRNASGQRIRVNGGPWSAYVSSGNFSSSATAFRFALNAGNAKLQMQMAEFWSVQSSLPSVKFDRKLAEIRRRYCLALR